MQQTEKVELKDIFSNSQLIIPEYQRDYSWTEKQVKDLFNDIIYSVDNYSESDTKYHYFGTLVLEKRDKIDGPTAPWDKYAIVDGQQRITTTTIFIRVVVDLLEKIQEQNITEEIRKDINMLHDSLLEEYIINGRIKKLKPIGLSKEPYDKIVIDGKNPDKVVDENSPLVSHKIKNAYDILDSKLEQELNDNSNSISDVIDRLRDIIFSFTGDFKLTPNILDDMDEASRMFKVINDRGRDLTALDRIKSHLMYCCTFVDDLEPEDISLKINNAIETITSIPNSSEDDLNRYVGMHGILFTGELRNEWLKNYDKYNKNYNKKMSYEDRIQTMPWYANVSRDKKSLKDFINNYVDSLEEMAEYYVNVRFPDYSYKKDNISKNMANTFYVYNQSGLSRPYEIFSIGCMYAFQNDQDKLEKCLNYTLTPAIFYNQVLKNTSSFSRLSMKVGHKAFWYRWSQEKQIKKDYVFESRIHSQYKIPDTEKELLNHIEKRYNSKISKNCSKDAVKNYMMEKDVLEGDYTDGWGGFRSKNTAKILLYYYEYGLRSNTGKLNIPILQKWCENTEIEHMLPQNPNSNKLTHHNKQVNKFGNLLILSSEDNISASNKPYKEKLNNHYNDVGLEMTKELPKNLTAKTIDNRSDEIIKKLIDDIYTI